MSPDISPRSHPTRLLIVNQYVDPGVLRISSHGDDRIEIFDSGILGAVEKFGKHFLGWHGLSRDFLVYS